MAGAGPGDDPLTIDLDSTVCETFGLSRVSLSSDSVSLNGKRICQSERLMAGSGDRPAPRLMGRLVGWVSERAHFRTVLRCTPN